MPIVGQSFTVGAEVCIMAHSTFVAITSNMLLVSCAQRTITIDTTMDLLATREILQWDVDRSEAVAWMLLGCSSNAGRAIVKVWTGQALVSNAADTL